MKKISNILISLLIIAALFTLIDYLAHYFIGFLQVTNYPDLLHLSTIGINLSPLILYSLAKFLSTFMLGLIVIFISRVVYQKYRILLFSIIITIILQVRYLFLSNYSLIWHFTTLIMHFSLLFGISWLIFKLLKVKI